MEFISKPVRPFKLTFPNYHDFPTERTELPPFTEISPAVSSDFFRPVVNAGFRHLRALTRMAMPKASVDEDDCSTPREDDIWGPRQVSTMYPKSVAHPMQDGTDSDLGLGVRPFNAGHQPAAAFGGQPVQERLLS